MKRLKESISMTKSHSTSNDNSRWIEYTVLFMFLIVGTILVVNMVIKSDVAINTADSTSSATAVTANTDETLNQKFDVVTISNDKEAISATTATTTDATEAKPSLRVTVGGKCYILSDGVYYPEEYLTKHTKTKVISKMITVHTSYSKDDVVYALRSDWHKKSLDVIHQNAKDIIDHFGSKNNGKTIITNNNNNNSDSNGVIIDNGNRIMLPSITDATTPPQDNDEDHYPLKLFRILHVGNNMFFVMIGGKM